MRPSASRGMAALSYISRKNVVKPNWAVWFASSAKALYEKEWLILPRLVLVICPSSESAFTLIAPAENGIPSPSNPNATVAVLVPAVMVSLATRKFVSYVRLTEPEIGPLQDVLFG